MTHVASITLTRLAIPFGAPLESASGVWRAHAMALLRAQTAEGAEGLAELRGEAGNELADRLTRACDGLDPEDTEAVGRVLEDLADRPADGRPAAAALRDALADLRAQAAGCSLAALLAAPGVLPRPDVAVNALIGRVEPADAARQARRHVLEGFGCLKVKGGGEPVEAIVARAAAVRAAAGEGIELRIDLNGSLDAGEARTLLDALVPLRIDYVEQPIAPAAGADALAALRRASSVAVAADEAVEDRASARALLDADAVDALVVKPARVGGLEEAAEIAALAATAGVRVTISTLFESGVGIAGALHVAGGLPGDQAHGLATASLLAADLLATRLPSSAGRMAVPAGPGLGVALDEAAVERYAMP